MPKAKRYEDRYVLGEGYPLGHEQEEGSCKTISLAKELIGPTFVRLNYPIELWDKDVPEYRLVLERIKER